MMPWLTLLTLLLLSGCAARAAPPAEAPAARRVALLERADESDRAGESLQAEQYYLAAWIEGAALEVLLPRLIATCVRGGRLASALRHVERARRVEPGDLALAHVEAELLRAVGHQLLALVAVRGLGTAASPLPESLYLLGDLERGYGDSEAAELAWRRYLEVAPDGPRAAQVRKLLGGVL